jgi:hypothetical protein
MQVIPHSKQDWLRFVVFPFKAYVVIAPLLFFISTRIPHPRHQPTSADVFFVVSLVPCSLILLAAALVFSLFGPKGFAFPCLGFSLAGLIIAVFLMPCLATT